MSNEPQWYIPSKKNGDPIRKKNMWWDENMYRAADEIAAEESKKVGRQISALALLFNLAALQRGPYYTELRNRLERRYKELKQAEKESRREHQTQQPNQQTYP